MTRSWLVFSLVLGCSSEAATAPSPSIAWGSCPSSTLECATLEVPLDWSKPEGKKLRVSMIRAPAEEPEQRLGTLFINPGGPGVPIVASVEANYPIVRALVPDLFRRFDVVAVAPRGVEGSGLVDCVTPADLDALRRLDLTPASDSGWRALDEVTAAVAKRCAEVDPELLANVDTVSTARDMDAVRAALGEQRVHFLGVSYGTWIGATYASLFPDRVGAFVFDAAFISRGDQVQTTLAEYKIMDAQLTRALAWCASSAKCAFHGGQPVDEVTRAFDATLAKADAGTPVAARSLENGDVYAAIRSWLARGKWDAMFQALAALEKADGAPFLERADYAYGREASGSYTDPIAPVFATSYLDIPCPAGLGVDTLKAGWTTWSAGTRITAPLVLREVAMCLHWPARAKSLAPIAAPSAPKMLFVLGKNDPVTPFEEGRALMTALANGSHLLTHDQEGHSALMYNACARKAEVAFLLDPSRPPSVANCPAE